MEMIVKWYIKNKAFQCIYIYIYVYIKNIVHSLKVYFKQLFQTEINVNSRILK